MTFITAVIFGFIVVMFIAFAYTLLIIGSRADREQERIMEEYFRERKN